MIGYLLRTRQPGKNERDICASEREVEGKSGWEKRARSKKNRAYIM